MDSISRLGRRQESLTKKRKIRALIMKMHVATAGDSSLEVPSRRKTFQERQSGVIWHGVKKMRNL